MFIQLCNFVSVCVEFMFNSSIIILIHLISEQCLEHEPRGADTGEKPAIKEKFVYESLCPPYYVYPHTLEHRTFI